MKWNKEAVQDLKDFDRLEKFIESYPEQIAALEEDFVSLKGCSTDKISVQGGTGRMDDSLINNIAKRERLTMNYAAAKKKYELIKAAFDTLTPVEKLVLDRFFIHRQEYHVEKLIEELHFEKSKVYELKDNALYKFTIMMYGIIDY